MKRTNDFWLWGILLILGCDSYSQVQKRQPKLEDPISIQSSNQDWHKTVKTGWCNYTFQVRDTSVINAIQKHKPGLIRWFVEWDRLDVKKWGKSLRDQRLQAFVPFFKACAENDVEVLLQMWMKERFWQGDNYGGVKWAKPSKLRNFPANIDASYGAFLRGLIDLMIESGMKEENIIVEAWNEPDLLWGLGETGVNYHTPWRLLNREGFNKWSGGSGEKWYELNHVLDESHPNVRYASNGVGVWPRHESWIEPCYQTDKISMIELHYYLWHFDSAQNYIDSIDAILGRWDKHLPEGTKPLPFIIGEIDRYSSKHQPLSTRDAQLMRQICELLLKKYPDRFYGMTIHGHEKWKGSRLWWYDDYILNE